MVADGRPHDARAAVHHQPQPALGVRLQFAEVVAAAHGGELEHAFAAPQRLQARITERVAGEPGGRTDGGAAIAAPRGHGPRDPRQELRGGGRLREAVRGGVEGHGQHAAADVPAHGLRVDELRRADRNADADILRQVHVRHDGDVPDIRRAAQPLDGLEHRALQWCHDPGVQRCGCRLRHRRPRRPWPARTTAPGPACG